MVCAPVRSIIPSLKLGDYLSVQAHKPCSNSHIIPPREATRSFKRLTLFKGEAKIEKKRKELLPLKVFLFTFQQTENRFSILHSTTWNSLSEMTYLSPFVQGSGVAGAGCRAGGYFQRKDIQPISISLAVISQSTLFCQRK